MGKEVLEEIAMVLLQRLQTTPIETLAKKTGIGSIELDKMTQERADVSFHDVLTIMAFLEKDLILIPKE